MYPPHYSRHETTFLDHLWAQMAFRARHERDYLNLRRVARHYAHVPDDVWKVVLVHLLTDSATATEPSASSRSPSERIV